MKDSISIDVGGTNLKAACLTSAYSIKHKLVVSTPSLMRREGLLHAITGSVKQILADCRLSKSGISGIGIGLPGPVDHESGLVHFLPNIPGIRNINLKRILTERLGMKVSVDNDAKLMCLAEHRLGAARGLDFVVCLTLGTGVGGGLILNGELYRGAQNASGEIGHIPVNVEGPVCNCGGTGCLEAYIGNNRILEEARSVFGRRITLEELSVMAKRRDKKAALIWENVGEHLGVALAGLVNVLNLDAVVIGGGVSRAGETLFAAVRGTVRRRAMAPQVRHVKILKAQLGYDAGLIGAAIMVREAQRGR